MQDCFNIKLYSEILLNSSENNLNPFVCNIIKDKNKKFSNDPLYRCWEITNDDIDDEIENEWEVIESAENNGHNMEMKEKIDLNFLKK